MRIRTAKHRILTLGACLALGGCGSPLENPNTRTALFFRTATVTLASTILGAASVCGLPFDAATGPVTATIGTSTGREAPFLIELKRGTCSTPGEVMAASSTGELTKEVAQGTYFVTVTNPSDETLFFVLEVSYLLPPDAPAP